MLGIFIGVASVIWLLAIGEGISKRAQQQIEELGANNLILTTVRPRSENNQSGKQMAYGLTEEDCRNLAAMIPTVEMAIQFTRRALAERPGLTWPYRDLAAFLAHSGDIAAARDALERFLKDRPGASLTSIGDGLRFMYPSLLSRYLRGLKLAGLE